MSIRVRALQVFRYYHFKRYFALRSKIHVMLMGVLSKSKGGLIFAVSHLIKPKSSPFYVTGELSARPFQPTAFFFSPQIVWKILFSLQHEKSILTAGKRES